MYLGKMVEIGDEDADLRAADAPVHPGAAVRGAGAGPGRPRGPRPDRPAGRRALARPTRLAAAGSTPAAGRPRTSARPRSPPLIERARQPPPERLPLRRDDADGRVARRVSGVVGRAPEGARGAVAGTTPRITAALAVAAALALAGCTGGDEHARRPDQRRVRRHPHLAGGRTDRPPRPPTGRRPAGRQRRHPAADAHAHHVRRGADPGRHPDRRGPRHRHRQAQRRLHRVDVDPQGGRHLAGRRPRDL